MRVPLFFLALVAGASASAWSDTSKLIGTADSKGGSWHGPGLIYKGEVWNGDKTVRFGTDSYVAKSVITGKDSYYPKTLPETLKTPYLVADSTHPNLAFWWARVPRAHPIFMAPPPSSPCWCRCRAPMPWTDLMRLAVSPGTRPTSSSKAAWPTAQK